MDQHLPPFRGTAWINTAALGPADLGDRPVLVDFWTLTCINWLRTQPYVRAWARRYRGDGLVVVGVHTPEFSFERDVDGVRRAVSERGIEYPVLVDNDYETWNAFGNHYWPALYFADADGLIRGHSFGEGRYEQSERRLQTLLGVKGDLVVTTGDGVEADADWEHLRTPETYLGYGRGERLSSRDAAPDVTSSYELPDRLDLNHWALHGEWVLESERAVLALPGGRLAFRYHARDVHLVLARRSPDPIPFQVLVDGARPGRAHGTDVDQDGNALLADSRLYQLVRARDAVRERTVEVIFRDPGAEAYAFTFG